MVFSTVMLERAADVIAVCRLRGVRIVTAESCTGGLIGACLTEIPGSSAVVDRGFITYSNEAKTDLLGVPVALLEAHGAVSTEVAKAMAKGARERAGVDLAIAVTGIAGPGGATADKPVGLVHLALALGDTIETLHEVFSGDRRAVRTATLERALERIERAVGSLPPT